MSGYKFRVKLIPGTLKKGKAVRQAAELMVTTKAGGGGGGGCGGEVSQRERDLIRCASVRESSDCFPACLPLACN